MAMLNLRIAEPAVLLDIARLAGARHIQIAGNKVEVGAAVTQNRLKDWPELGCASCRCSPRRCRSSGISRPATKGPCAARSRTPIRPRSCRCRWRRWAARWCCARGAARASLAAHGFPARHARRPRASRDELIIAVRFPVQSTRQRGVPRGGAAARRFRHHRDCGGDRGPTSASVRVGIGGVADRPAVRGTTIDGAGAARTFFDALAWELEGYDDIHASARLRRDLLRRRRPGHGGRGSAMRRVNKDEQVRIALHAQWPPGLRRRRAAHAADRLPAPRDRRDRHPCRLRARRVRLLHGVDRRRCGALLPHPRGAGRRPRRHHRRVARRRRTAHSTRCRRHSSSIMPCNAGSARPAS